MFIGTLFIVIGVFALLANLGIISVSVGEIFWPILFIAIGVWFVLKKRGPCHCGDWKNFKEHFHGESCDCEEHKHNGDN
jgi:hypothetical protein